MTQAAPLLSIHGLGAWYEKSGQMLQAVAGMSLQVHAGEALGVVGESGSGKTQTFFSVLGLSHGWPGLVEGTARFAHTDLLAGLEKHAVVTRGVNGEVERVEKNTQRWNSIHHARLEPILGREIALMFQDAKSSLVPYWTIGRHLDHVLRRAHGRTVPASHAEEIISRFGLREPKQVLRKYADELSGGEAQRSMMAIVMASRPRLLIADEPTTALDAVNQLRVLAELERVHAEAETSLIMISHDLAVVRRVVDRVVVVFGGTVVERAPVSLLTSGSVDDGIHPYSHELRESQRRRAVGAPITGAAAHGGVRRMRGCPYADRCSLRPKLSGDAQQRCAEEKPPERQIADDHFVSCWGVAA